MMHFEKKNTAGALFLALKQMPHAKCGVDIEINKYVFFMCDSCQQNLTSAQSTFDMT